MKKIDFDLWVEYHTKRRSNYTNIELLRIKTLEIEMNILVPYKELLQKINLEEFYNDSITNQLFTIKHLAEEYGVEPVVISIKLDELINKLIVLPKSKVLEMVDIDELNNDSAFEQTMTIQHLADSFDVSFERMEYRLEELSKEKNKNKFNIRKRGLKK